MISALAESFFLQIAFGIGLFSFLVDTRETGLGLLKLFTVICLCLGVLALVLQLSSTPLVPLKSGVLITALTALGGGLLFHGEKKSLFVSAMSLMGLLCLLYTLVLFYHGRFDAILFSLSSGLLVGIVLYGMLLGHWYLVTPKLSARPMEQMHLILWPILIFKISWSCWELFHVQTTLQEISLFNFILLAMRIVWGYLILLVMSFFSWKLVRMRSFQSATGILYACTFFVLVGELISGYLYFDTGIFL